MKPPRVKGSPVALECKLWKAMQDEDGLSHLVLGEVLGWYLRDDVHVRGRVDFGALHPVGRLAAEYTHVNNAFVPPLDPALLAELTAGRMARLDGLGDTYAGVDDVTWSPSGSVLVAGGEGVGAAGEPGGPTCERAAVEHAGRLADRAAGETAAGSARGAR